MAKKVLAIILAFVLVVGVSAGTAYLVGKRGGSDVEVIENGLSAYEIAVQYGYDGTVTEWLESLKGSSAYRVAVDNGYTGTEAEWLESLKAASENTVMIKNAEFNAEGELLLTFSDGSSINLGAAVGKDGKDGVNGTNGTDGKDGADGVNGKDGLNGTAGEDGVDGKDGLNGTDGKDGKDGKDGVSITGASINVEGELILKFSDGTSVNLDKVVGMNGNDGVSVVRSEINGDGELVICYSNGQEANLGTVIGAKGDAGADGRDGISVISTEINNSGELVVTYSDNRSENLGVVVGRDGIDGTNGTDGKDGTDGTDGTDGKDGTDGIGITSAEITSGGELVLCYSNGQRSNLGKVIGADGKDGINGTDGKDGADGVSVVKSEINARGELVITYSDGNVDNLGVIVGRDGINGTDGKDGTDGVNGTDGKDGADGKTPYIKDGNWWIGETDTGVKAEGVDGADGADGADGVGIKRISVSEAGDLSITLTNDTTLDLGCIKGADGEDGTNGTDGKDGTNGADGVSVTGAVINSSNELVLTFSNGNEKNLGVVVGRDGVNGTDGKDGINGTDGKDGADGKSPYIKDGNWWIGETDTGVKAEGVDGTDGINGTDGTDGKDGINGTDGKDGADGKTPYIKDGNWWIGETDTGVKAEGVDGTDGKDGTDGTNGTDGIGIKKTEINALGELVITYTDNNVANLGVIVSDNGGDGTGALAPRVHINGDTNEWEISTDGGRTWTSTGVKATGADGKDGLNGTDGKDGTNGTDGKDGADGKTPFIKDGNWWIGETDTGVKAEGVDGTDGKDGTNGTNGTDGKDGVGVSGAEINNEDHLVIKLSNGSSIDVGVVKGADGADGTNGTNGIDGKDGIGISNVTVSEDGNLKVTLDNGTEFDLGNIKGKDGVGISKTEINADGKLVITYTDGKAVTLDKVVGADGVGIQKVELTDGYMLKLTFTDGNSETVGPVRGEKGADGVGIKNISVGDDGYLYVTFDGSETAEKIAYIKGEPGVDGKTPYIKNGNWWIGDSDTGIKAAGEKGADGADGTNGADGVSVVNSYVDSEYHLWIVLSNGNRIDAGYVGVTPSTPDPTTFTVVFKDYDGRVLKSEEVESGGSATAPEAPSRTGYNFTGWDKEFSNVTSGLVITAQYQAITEPTVIIGNVSGKAGESVTVDVSVVNNPGLFGAIITYNFDSALTLTAASAGSAFDNLDVSFPKYNSPFTVFCDGIDDPATGDGVIMSFTFTIPSGATVGQTYDITASYIDGDIVDGNFGDVDMAFVPGSITVK